MVAKLFEFNKQEKVRGRRKEEEEEEEEEEGGQHMKIFIVNNIVGIQFIFHMFYAV